MKTWFEYEENHYLCNINFLASYSYSFSRWELVSTLLLLLHRHLKPLGTWPVVQQFNVMMSLCPYCNPWDHFSNIFAISIQIYQFPSALSWLWQNECYNFSDHDSHAVKAGAKWIQSGPRLNIKTVLSRYGDSYVKDKKAVRTSYL